MRRLTFTIFALLAVLALAPTNARAAVIQVGALAENDFVDWSVISPDFTSVASPFVTSSTVANVTVTADDGAAGFTRLTQGTAAGCDGVTPGQSYCGNFAPGDAILVTFMDPIQGPFSNYVDFTFGSPVQGVGTQIQSNLFGDYTATLSVFNGAMLLGTFNVVGVSDALADDSAPYLGALSDSFDITRALFTVTVNGDLGLGINRLELITNQQPNQNPVPEPATLSLLALGGAMGAARRWRKSRQQS